MERKSACDKLGDCVIAILEEGSFWMDVFRTTMNWDEESVIRDAQEKLKQFEKFENVATLQDVQDANKKKM
jgi:alpha-amylase/alpha-mannosidase (GH57 family)